jgi:hypothetical protein
MLVYSLSQGTELPEEPIKPKKLKRWLTKNGIQAPEPLVAEK